MKIIDRYATAVRASNLRSDPTTTTAPVDVLGAAGLAGKKHPLAFALTRLFCGDNGAAREMVRVLAEMAHDRAIAHDIALKRTQAVEVAQAVLAWHRDGTCRPCNGHGYQLIKGAPSIGDIACMACAGTRKMPFDKQFPFERRVIARWLLAEVEREQSRAGPAAMAKLAPRLEF